MTKIAFLGDISLNDDYVTLHKSKANPFSKVQEKLNEFDFVIGNLECTVEGKDGENSLKKPRIKTQLETLEYLKTLNINIVSLSNNHIYDNLHDGFIQTINFLNKNKIKYIGAGLSKEEAEKPLIISFDDIKICFLSYISEDTNPNLPNNSSVFLNILDPEKVKNNISDNSECDYIVLLLHWGGNFEGGYYPDFKQITQSKEFIKSGADIIVGHHSHTFQPKMQYANKPIFFSLGNFCFADILSDGKLKKVLNFKRYTESVILSTIFTKDSIENKIIPIKNKNLFLSIQNTLKIKYFIRNILFNSLLKRKIFWLIYKFSFKFIFPYYQIHKKHLYKHFKI